MKLSKQIADGILEETFDHEEQKQADEIDIFSDKSIADQVKESEEREAKKTQTVDVSTLSFDEFCEYTKQEAKEQGKPDPDFDFRDDFAAGMEIYLVRSLDLLKAKKLVYLKVRTVYPRMMVGVMQNGMCECISYDETSNIFKSFVDAKQLYDSIDLPEGDIISKKREE